MEKVIFLLPDLGSGGAERVVSLLSNEMVRQGINVTILMLFNDRVAYETDDKVRIEKCDLMKKEKKGRVRTLRNILKGEIEGYKEVTAISFQDSCLKYLLSASRLLPIKVVATERNNPYRKGRGLLNKIRASLPFLLADYAVFQTPGARSYYSLLRDKKCSVISNPISETSYRWKGNLDQHKLITVCRLHPQKNLSMAIDVVDRLRLKYPDVTLDIYGEGELRDELQRKIEKKGLSKNIRLMGTTNNVQEKMSEASVFILTSDFEGISNSMLEAMSVGMPIACTDCPIGGARMILGNGAGRLTPVKDTDAFVRNVEDILADGRASMTMAEMAYRKSFDYSIEKTAKRWIQIAFKK